MDDTASSPPEQAETEPGFGSGLREQLARNREAREQERLQAEEVVSPVGEAASSPLFEEPDAPADAERELDEAIARGEELRRSLSARHAKLAEWVASQGREIHVPEAAALLASGAAEAELDRRREEAAQLERRGAELREREAALAERERQVEARAQEAARQAAEAERSLQSTAEREAELNARAQRLAAGEEGAEERRRRLAEEERERSGSKAFAERLAADRAALDARAEAFAARERDLDARAAALDEREERIGRREDALGELKDWLVGKERQLAAYLGDEPGPAD